eukprot:gene3275-4125_t
MGSIMLMLSEGLSTQLLLLAGTNQDVMPAALSYFRVRALAQPAVSSLPAAFDVQVILIAVMQGGLLAVKDSITPLKSTAVGCVVNILGDYLMGAKLLYVLLVLGVICGGLSGMLVAGVGHFTPWVLTQDPSLYPIIASTVVPGFIALSISGAMEVAEGVMLISSKDDNNRLLRAMALTIILLNMLLFYNQKAEFGILGVW